MRVMGGDFGYSLCVAERQNRGKKNVNNVVSKNSKFIHIINI